LNNEGVHYSFNFSFTWIITGSGLRLRGRGLPKKKHIGSDRCIHYRGPLK